MCVLLVLITLVFHNARFRNLKFDNTIVAVTGSYLSLQTERVTNVTVLWDVTPCSLEEVWLRFGMTCWLYFIFCTEGSFFWLVTF